MKEVLCTEKVTSLWSRKNARVLTPFFPMFSFNPPENIRKPKVYWYFHRDQNRTLKRKRLISWRYWCWFENSAKWNNTICKLQLKNLKLCNLIFFFSIFVRKGKLSIISWPNKSFEKKRKHKRRLFGTKENLLASAITVL